MSDELPYASVAIEGIDLSGNVSLVDVEDSDRAIDRARIIFNDSDEELAQIAREQTKLTVTLGWSSENALIFEGLVVAAKTEATGKGRQRVALTAYDLSYRMRQQKPKPRSFTSGTLSAALNAIVADYAGDGITAGDIVPNPDVVYTPSQALMKPEGQTDWDFIARLTERYRARAFVEVNDSQSQFYFVPEAKLLAGDSMGTLTYAPLAGGELLAFRYQRTASGAAPVYDSTVIDPITGKPVSNTDTVPPPEAALQVTSDASDQLTQAAGIIAGAAGKTDDARPKRIAIGQASDPAGTALRFAQDPTRALGFYGRGVCVGTIKLRAKGKVTIQGLSPWASGDWYVQRVNHVFTRGSNDDAGARSGTFETRFAVTR